MGKLTLSAGVAAAAIGVSLLAAGAAHAVVINSTWIGGNSNWNNAANWNPAGVPNNGANTFNVLIDNGDGGTNSIVGLDVSVTIDTLTVDSNDTLNFNNSRDIGVVGSVVINNGAINMNAVGASTDLVLSGASSITGSGFLTLSNSLNNRIFVGAAADVITNGTNHTIRGAGQLLTNAGGVTNDGTIVQLGTQALIINPGAPGFVNNGTFRADGAGGILLRDGLYTNNSTMEAATGSNITFDAAGATIVGGDLTTTGTGEIRTNLTTTGATLDNVRLTNDSLMVSANGADLRIENGFVNDGTFRMNAGGSSTDLQFVGTQTISNTAAETGEIVMSDSVNNRIRANVGASVLTNGASHTIRGAGQLLINTGGMINDGTIVQEGAQALIINPGAPGFVNNGTFRADGAGGILLRDGLYTNNSTMEAATGSNITFDAAGATIVGGDLTTTGTGEIRTNVTTTGPLLDNVRLTNNSLMVSANGADLRIRNGLVNDGTFRMNAGGSSTDLRFVGTQTIGGTGEIVMSNSVNNRIRANLGADVLTNGANHTIRGAGQLLNNAGALINDGTILQQGTQKLTFDPGATVADIGTGANMVNNGVFRAEGSGGMDLTAAVYLNNTAIEVANGSFIDFGSAGTEIIGGNLTTSGTGEFRTAVNAGALLDGVTLTTDSRMVSNNGLDLRFENGFTNNGEWTVNAGGASTDIRFVGTQSIFGTGEIVLSDSVNNRIFANVGADVLTNSANHTIRGAGQLLINAGGVTNDGTILQQGAQTLTINPGAPGFVNNGTFRAEGAGGIRLQDGLYTNNSTMEAATGSNITFNATGATIVGGDLTTTGTGEIRTNLTTTGATLDNVRLTNDSLMVSANGADLRIENGLVNDGTFRMNAGGSSTDLQFVGTQTISNTAAETGEIVMSDSVNNRIRANVGASVLTNGASHTIRGAGQLLINTGGMINDGTIVQEGAQALIINPGAPGFVNNGTFRADGAGGILLRDGLYTNNSTMEAATGSNITFDAAGATIVGGDLTTTGTGEIRTNLTTTGATLDNVRLTNDSLMVSANGADLRIRNGFVNDGTFRMNAGGSSTDLQFVGTQTISNTAAETGEIVMSDSLNNRIRANGGADVLTNGASHTIRGAGQLLNNTGGMINQGTIIADQVTNVIQIDGGTPTFMNLGTLRASGAAGFDIRGSGNQFVQGGGLVDVQVSSRLDMINGNYLQTGGQTTVNGILTTAGSNSTVELQGGRFGGTGTVDFNGSGVHAINNTGGTMAVGNSPGILTVQDGDYVQASLGNFEYELFGATVGVGHDLLQIFNGDADLAGDLDVITNLPFATTLSIGDQFEVIRLDSLGTFIDGDFFDSLTVNVAGLAFTQLFLGTSLFIEVTEVNFGPPAVPEPETLLIVLMGLGIMIMQRRRRRTI